MWQQEFERYGNEGFTVVGLSLEVEGVAPAKLYYEKFGVTFPALVDPNYATGFGAVPKTFFVDEHGVVRKLTDWEQRLRLPSQLKPVTDRIRKRWTAPGKRLESDSIGRLVSAHEAKSSDLAVAVELASRYADLDLTTEAESVLETAITNYDPRETARSEDGKTSQLLSQAFLQLSRVSAGDRDAQVKYATMSFYLNPTVGFGKQIARIIAPDKFDGRPSGDFDNRFREGTLRRLQTERKAWLAQGVRP